MKYAFRTPSGDGQQADHLSDVLEAVTPSPTASQRLAFEKVESASRIDAIGVCVVTCAFVLAWLLLDPAVELAHSIFFGAMK